MTNDKEELEISAADFDLDLCRQCDSCLAATCIIDDDPIEQFSDNDGLNDDDHQWQHEEAAAELPSDQRFNDEELAVHGDVLHDYIEDSDSDDDYYEGGNPHEGNLDSHLPTATCVSHTAEHEELAVHDGTSYVHEEFWGPAYSCGEFGNGGNEDRSIDEVDAELEVPLNPCGNADCTFDSCVFELVMSCELSGGGDEYLYELVIAFGLRLRAHELFGPLSMLPLAARLWHDQASKSICRFAKPLRDALFHEDPSVCKVLYEGVLDNEVSAFLVVMHENACKLELC